MKPRRCSFCGFDLELYNGLNSEFCTNCGKALDESVGSQVPSSEKAPTEVTSFESLLSPSVFFETIRQIVFKPRKFFEFNARAILSRSHLVQILAFSIIVQWIASFFGFIWRASMAPYIQSRVDDVMNAFQIMVQMQEESAIAMRSISNEAMKLVLGAGGVVLAPFTSTLQMVVVSAIVHFGVKLFIKEVDQRPQSYTTTLKVIAFSLIPSILVIIPGLGTLLSWVLCFYAAVIGIREVYQTSTTRSVFAVLFPEIISMLCVLLVAAFFLFLIFVGGAQILRLAI